MKTEVAQLAVFGGDPDWAEPLHVGRPNIGSREDLYRRLDEMLNRRWLTNDGPIVREFEERLCEIVGVEHCIVTANGMAALEVLLRALELEGEVIVPSFTFIGTVHALMWSGLTPVFCDVDPATHTLAPARVEELVSAETSAILGVHLWGAARNVDQLRAVADQHSLKLLFDAAHAFGATYGGEKVGTLGTAEVFSFHATKIVNSFEGGAVATNDIEIAKRVRLLRNYGFEDFDRVVSLGTNAKLSESAAAMGLASLDSLDEFLGANRRNLQSYRQGLSSVPGVHLVSPEVDEGANGHYVVVEVDAEDGLTRDQLQDVLWREGVLARRYFYPGCHAMEPYATVFPDARLRLPETVHLVERVLCLPTGTAVAPVDVDAVCSIISLAQTHADEVRIRLAV